jgi:hypothetical protein
MNHQRSRIDPGTDQSVWKGVNNAMTKPLDWLPPPDWLKITTIEAHAGGEPLRVIVEGLPPIPGDTILAKRRFLKQNLDFLRTALMW